MSVKITSEEMNQLRTKFGEQVTTSELQSLGGTLYWRASQGGLQKLSRALYSLSDVPVVVEENEEPEIEQIQPITSKMTRGEKAVLINERFEVMDILSDSIISGNTRSLIVSGAAGVGKSYTLEQKLEGAVRSGKVNKVTTIKGSISAISLYIAIYENREKGQIIILDDADVFGDEETMNILKGALDSSTKREISWMKMSTYLADAGIPNQFEYFGQIVFLTNCDMVRVCEKGGKMAPHMKALLSRAVFLDLGIHSSEEILIRIEQVMATSTMRTDLGLEVHEASQIMDWMLSNETKLRYVSLRTVIQLSGFLKTTADWQKIARTTLLKHSF